MTYWSIVSKHAKDSVVDYESDTLLHYIFNLN